jgi:hypothetical protein
MTREIGHCRTRPGAPPLMNHPRAPARSAPDSGSLPPCVGTGTLDSMDERLHALLDQQEQGAGFTPAERTAAEGRVTLAELLALLRLRTHRVSQEGSPGP